MIIYAHKSGNHLDRENDEPLEGYPIFRKPPRQASPAATVQEEPAAQVPQRRQRGWACGQVKKRWPKILWGLRHAQ